MRNNIANRATEKVSKWFEAKLPCLGKFWRRHKVIAVTVMMVIIALFYLFWPDKTASPVQTKPSEATPSPQAESKPDISVFGLDIPKINVWVPIVAGVNDENETEYLKAIENGIALSKNFAQGPKENGSLFIFGHSKYYKDRPGNYKEVFKDLNQLSPRDKFNLYYKNETFVYEVTESKVVSSTELSIRDATPDDPNDKTLTLMTCWPPGTTAKRWVVFAKQI